MAAMTNAQHVAEQLADMRAPEPLSVGETIAAEEAARVEQIVGHLTWEIEVTWSRYDYWEKRDEAIASGLATHATKLQEELENVRASL